MASKGIALKTLVGPVDLNKQESNPFDFDEQKVWKSYSRSNGLADQYDNVTDFLYRGSDDEVQDWYSQPVISNQMAKQLKDDDWASESNYKDSYLDASGNFLVDDYINGVRHNGDGATLQDVAMSAINSDTVNKRDSNIDTGIYGLGLDYNDYTKSLYNPNLYVSNKNIGDLAKLFTEELEIGSGDELIKTNYNSDDVSNKIAATMLAGLNQKSPLASDVDKYIDYGNKAYGEGKYSTTTSSLDEDGKLNLNDETIYAAPSEVYGDSWNNDWDYDSTYYNPAGFLVDYLSSDTLKKEKLSKDDYSALYDLYNYTGNQLYNNRKSRALETNVDEDETPLNNTAGATGDTSSGRQPTTAYYGRNRFNIREGD